MFSLPRAHNDNAAGFGVLKRLWESGSVGMGELEGRDSVSLVARML
jgi:hypothetical protein